MLETATQSDPGLVRGVKSDGRRVFELQAKLAIVREAMAPEVSLAKVALRHGLNANLLRKWVVKLGGIASAATNPAIAPSLLPVVIKPSGRPKAVAQRRASVRESASIEIGVGEARIRIGATASAQQIEAIIRALR